MSFPRIGSGNAPSHGYTRSQPLQCFEVWIPQAAADEVHEVLFRANSLGSPRKVVSEGELIKPYADQWYFRWYVDATTAEELSAILRRHGIEVRP